MINFNLNIDLFYEFELTKGLEVKAIACIEYPIIHIIAKTKETIEEAYDYLDRFIVDSSFKYKGINIKNLSDLTGINTSVFTYRVNELVKQDYISVIKVQNEETIILKKPGIDFLNDLEFQKEIVKTRSFILDGVTHSPLKSYFYKEGKDNLISEDEKDKYGNKNFNPAIIPNPPDKFLKSKILEIPIDQRANYNIPVGLKDITDFDFFIMTYPLAIVLSRTKDGRTSKKLIDSNGFYSEESCVEIWQKEHEVDIRKVEILIAEFDRVRDRKNINTIIFQNNWGKPRIEISKRIFNVQWSKVHLLIKNQYDLTEVSASHLLVDDFGITLKIDEKLILSENANKKKIIDACIRKRDYLKHNPKTGVWLVFIEVITVDDFVKGLIDLSLFIKLKLSIQELLSKYNYNYKLLRNHLIAIERFDYLENLDIHLFLYSRETSVKQNYSSYNNE